MAAHVAQNPLPGEPAPAAVVGPLFQTAGDSIEVVSLLDSSDDDAQGITCYFISYIPHGHEYHAGCRFLAYTDVGVSVSPLSAVSTATKGNKSRGQQCKTPDRGESKDTATSVHSSEDETEGHCIFGLAIQVKEKNASRNDCLKN